eukprot:358943-Chlamydomonas_euryale.AAC.1
MAGTRISERARLQKDDDADIGGRLRAVGQDGAGGTMAGTRISERARLQKHDDADVGSRLCSTLCAWIWLRLWFGCTFGAAAAPGWPPNDSLLQGLDTCFEPRSASVRLWQDLFIIIHVQV